MAQVAEPKVKALVILGQGGKSIYSTYYDEELRKHEKELEKKLYVKASGIQAPMDAEIMLVDNVISVFRTGQDVWVFIVGSAEENELILVNALNAFFDAVSIFLHGDLDMERITLNLDSIMLCADEVFDRGALMELDAETVATRVLMKGSEKDEVPLAELTLEDVVASAREAVQSGMDSRNW